MKNERILTQHPKGRKGVNILKARYNTIKDFIVKTIKLHGEISFGQLSDIAVKELSDNFDGKVLWYIVTVKLDLEARQIIERIPKTSPHILRLK